MLIAKILFLFLGILYTMSVFLRAVYKQDIPFITMFLAAAGIAGFIVLQFLV